MPLRFRVERALDNPAVQSIFYGPTLMAVQREAVGNNLESGLIPMSFYRHLKLDGDLRSAMTPSGKPMHFETNGFTLAPFYVSDPDPSVASPYHLYVRREEPAIVFGSIDSGVPNRSRDDGLTFLDMVWDEAPFAITACSTQRRGEDRVGMAERPADSTGHARTAVVDAVGRQSGHLRT